MQEYGSMRCRQLHILYCSNILLFDSELNKKSVQLMGKFGLAVHDQYIRAYIYGKIDPLKDDVYATTSADVCGF